MTEMVPGLLLVYGILVTVRLPRSAARPGPALLARGDDPPGTLRWPQAPFLRHGAWAVLALAALLATGCGAGAGTPPGQPRDPGSSTATPATSPAAQAVATGRAPAAD